MSHQVIVMDAGGWQVMQPSSNTSEDGFTSISNRSRKKQQRHPYRHTTTLTFQEQVDKARKTISDRRKALEAEREWYRQWREQILHVRTLLNPSKTTLSDVSDVKNKDAIPTPDLNRLKIVCLGIGKICESREAQYQYALLQELVEGLDVSSKDVELFDPMFTPIDIEILRSDGYTLLSKNTMGAHSLDPGWNTLAYFPHCPRALYESFLRENWTSGDFVLTESEMDIETEQVTGSGSGSGNAGDSDGGSESEDGRKERMTGTGRCVLLANDLKEYCLSVPNKKLETESPCINRIGDKFASSIDIPLILKLLLFSAPHLLAVSMPHISSSHPSSNAFSSLAFQYLPLSRKKEVDWRLPPLRVRDESEKQGGGGEVISGGIGELDGLLGDRGGNGKSGMKDLEGKMGKTRI